MVQTALPIDRYVPGIVDHVREQRTAVIVAPPGSGKTTRIPPALANLAPTIVLQPRRVAARALARRIASERGWTLGEEIGWQIRFERRFTKQTRLLVATEGILTARLQADPLLTDFGVIVLDEFHERSIHADLAIALAREALRSRDDLALVVMSATIDAAAVSEYLGGARVFEIDATTHPVDVRYRPGATVPEAIREVLPQATGDVLAFLPGAREIERARNELAGVDALVLPLHGSLDVDEQERAIQPAGRRKVILATNVAETSLTVEGVTEVIDSGLHKVLRYDAESGIDHLVLERISADSAQQRTGRAGRTAPGRATRLWDARDLLRPHREPEINRVDLAATVLDVIAWGADPRTFPWFEGPDTERLDLALELLRRIGAITADAVRPRLTEDGEAIRRMPLHPRLARLILAADGDERAIAMAIALSEGVRVTRNETTLSDAFAIADAIPRYRIKEISLPPREKSSRGVAEEKLLRAILAAFPDRVAMRREPGSDRLLLSSGTGAVLARESGVREGEFLVALEIGGTGSGEALVRVASFVDRSWLTATRREVTHSLENGRVKAIERVWYGALLLHEESVTPDPAERDRLLGANALARIDPDLQRRLRFARLDVDWESLLAGTTRVSDYAAMLPYDVRHRLDKQAPASLALPSGRSARLEYRDDGSVFAAVKLQELFGLGDTPRLGPDQTPVTFELLSPAGRPVQVTRDLRSFWNGAYGEVRKELRARYPKHPWPEDPWTATPTHRTTRRR